MKKFNYSRKAYYTENEIHQETFRITNSWERNLLLSEFLNKLSVKDKLEIIEQYYRG
ncbi:MAG: hypothetical protein Unbinned585contig1001_8 [Prokaryotic dsDNA virus sp.]|nr:MAG: hypothetical protein Unbinned585contig1001_8 [Prokaryotic dsDNA virus sp.]|tara:strand:+ start:9142 stop:9312 length:171 start_codon:yes stop_codon:yes gene_type:complete